MKKSLLNKNTGFQYIWLSLFPSLLVVSFYLAWNLLSSQHFLYEFWYDNTKLESFIDFYAPQNKFKPEFSLTHREERIRVFSVTLEAVNNDGNGLDNISFYSPEGERLGGLLNQAEIEHLDLVADLVSFFKSLAWVCIAFIVLGMFIVNIKKAKLPSIKNVLATYFVGTLIVYTAILVIGPADVFIFLHEQFFPINHQWFFYYQDSLMTTLMMAPDLFAYFAIAWCGLSLFIFVFLSVALVKAQNYILTQQIKTH